MKSTYRIVKKYSSNETVKYSIHQFYYDSNNKIKSSNEVAIFTTAETLIDFANEHKILQDALDAPLLEETHRGLKTIENNEQYYMTAYNRAKPEISFQMFYTLIASIEDLYERKSGYCQPILRDRALEFYSDHKTLNNLLVQLKNSGEQNNPTANH